MEPSPECIALIKRSEGCVLTSYADVDGSYVLGYGCKMFDGVAVVPNQTTDAAGADRNCRSHAQQCAHDILHVAHIKITQGQLDALVDFVYNLGFGALLQSTLLHTLNAGRTVTESMFTMWNKIHKDGVLEELPALTIRRQAEYQLFVG